MNLKKLREDIVFFFSDEYWDLFVEFTDEEIGILEMTENNLPRKGFILRLAIFGFGLIQSLTSLLSISSKQKNTLNSCPETLILCNSSNEHRSTKFLEKNPDCNIFYFGTFQSKGCSTLKVYFTSLLFLPLLLIRYIYSNPKQRNLYKFLSDQFLLVMGWRSLQRNIFQKRNLGTIVYSNHMSPINRSAISIARKYSKATIIYIEHTIMLPYWPAVDADIYFLSGEFSLNNIMKRSQLNEKEIYLLGSPKNDVLNFKREKNKKHSIGLCVSTVDDLEITRDFIINILIHKSSPKLIVRPHPAFRNFETQLNINDPRLFIRKPTDESLEDFLSSIDQLLVNDSGIFFEGLISGAEVIRVKLSHNFLNNYGVPEEFSDMYNKTASEVVSAICSEYYESNTLDKSKFFFDNVATKFENNSSEIISKVISAYIMSEENFEKQDIIKNNFYKLDINECSVFKLRNL